MALKIYNTLTRAKDEVPENGGRALKLFVCGPTVYDYAHIGHARTYIFFDFFAKHLRHWGYDVFYLQNITDVDDKIIKRAEEDHRDAAEVAAFFTQAYFDDMKALGVDAITKYAPATKFIPQIETQVQRLIEKEYAYKIEGDGWYFDIAKFPDYGKLSGRTAVQAEDGVSRIDEAVGKKNKGDFCLWKFSRPGEPVWKSSLGDGRPGWHIEDTAITESEFGPQYDIHGGGVDLKFPHHEAEIAQQESASGKKPFVKIWMHTGALLVEGKKMSKSLGNFITIRDFLKKHSVNALRWLVFSHHYRSPINYSEEAAQQAEAALANIGVVLGKLDIVSKENNETSHELQVNSELHAANEDLEAGLADDVGTPFLTAHIFGLIEKYQEKIWNMRSSEAKLLQNYVQSTLKMLGITISLPEIPDTVRKLAEAREQSRASKQFVQSDALRKQINELGYEIEDTKRGPFIWRKHQS